MTDEFIDKFLKDNGIRLNEDYSTGFVDTGSYAFNALISGTIYGGYADDRVTGLAGEESTGKSYLALSGVRSFIDADPNNYCLYFESENSVTPDVMRRRGIDVRRAKAVDIDTIQDFKHRSAVIVDNLLKMKEEDRRKNRFLWVLDSLGNLPSAKELDDSIKSDDGPRDMTRTQLIRSLFRILTKRLGRLRIPMIVVNHTYQVIGSYVPTKEMAGGGGLKFAASTIVFLSRKRDRDEKTKEVTGNIITARIMKSRFTKEEKKVDLLLDFSTGVDRYYGLYELAEDYGILSSRSAGNKGKLIIMPDGTEHSQKDFDANPKRFWTKDLLDRLDTDVQKDFKLGTADPLVMGDDDDNEDE